MTVLKTFDRKTKKAHHVRYFLEDYNHSLYLWLRNGQLKAMRHRITVGEDIRESVVNKVPVMFAAEVQKILSI